MYDFKDFEGKDKYERFKALQKKIHQEAVEEYFRELHDEATAKGENRALIPKQVILKDGTKLSTQEITEYAKKNNVYFIG